MNPNLFIGNFRPVFYPLVTPLRRDGQGLSSDEASGFTSCTACDRHFLIPNRFKGHDHGALRMQSPALCIQPPVLRLQPHGGWPFYRAGLRAQRATLPKLLWWRARPKALVFLHLNDSFLRESPFEVNAHAHHIILVARTWRARWFPKAVLSPCNKAAFSRQKGCFGNAKALL